jgi:hypothetical protein
MRRSGKGSGGGAGMNKNVSPRVKVGERARAIREKGVSQIGTQRSNHATDTRELLRKDVERVRGEMRPSGGPGGIPLGNEVAKNVGRGGPGAGRSLMHCGSQGVHGSPAPGNPPSKSRDILSSFGRESPIVSERKR